MKPNAAEVLFCVAEKSAAWQQHIRAVLRWGDYQYPLTKANTTASARF